MPTTEGPSDGAGADANGRTGDQIEQETREKATAEMKWAAAEAQGSPKPDQAAARPGKPATGEEQAAENRADESPA